MKQQSDQGVTDGASPVTGDSMQTPSTSVTTMVPRGPNLINDADPQDGERFIVVERSTGKALAVVNGKLELQACDGTGTFGSQWHWHWDCSLKNGWLGFRNRVTGRYLGYESNKRNPTGEISNEAIEHGAFERLHASRSSDGSHILYAPYHDELRRIKSGVTGEFFLGKIGGIEWEFIKVAE
ncbi:hypothetical protein C2857_004677 [Epichloe festucae Fl1]|uniref:Uncharacterized protein n=1 Tax=Epichloe festucae (strain Fl1) TaxID=877507 RepID=A0A7S9KV50_EPIFF|nr:hypothetical protein C2857_004677 [Epichloe festucae Fl1]